MSFSYDFTSEPDIAYVRLLIPDTQEETAVFSDEEIRAFYRIQASQFQSSMFYSYPAGRNLPAQPLSYLRVAALAIDTLANNSARLSQVIQILDVKLSSNAAAATALREGAKNYREVDDNAGAIAVIEQCPTVWALSDRFWKQVQRQSGGYFG